MKRKFAPRRVILSLIIMLLNVSQLMSQTGIPVQSTWFAQDNSGRMYDTKHTKERYRTNEKGEIHGKYFFYNKDGKTKIRSYTYVNGIKQGESIVYDAYGYITIQNFINGKLEGQSITYSDRTKSNIYIKRNYKNGKLNGDFIKIFSDGSICEKGKYVDDKKEGYWIEYHGNGSGRYSHIPISSVRSEGIYINGKRDGVWKNFEKRIDDIWVEYITIENSNTSYKNGENVSQKKSQEFVLDFTPSPEYLMNYASLYEKHQLEVIENEDFIALDVDFKIEGVLLTDADGTQFLLPPDHEITPEWDSFTIEIWMEKDERWGFNNSTDSIIATISRSRLESFQEDGVINKTLSGRLKGVVNKNTSNPNLPPYVFSILSCSYIVKND